MTSLSLTFFLDIVIALLLIATIVYGSILNRKLGALRSNKAELDVLIQSFNDACMRAEAGVRNLRSATEEAHRLQQYLSRGQVLRDDISFLIDRGSGLADRLEGTVRSARSEAQTQGLGQGGFGKGSSTAVPSEDFPRRGASRGSAGGNPAPEKIVAREITPAALEPYPAEAARGAAGGEEVSAGTRGGRTPRERANLRAESRAGGETVPRSRAEKDLLDALRAKR
ncbi:MAG: DUF6468 domain-containing protein [Alphaproteobacteria bacterium]|nr:DUF6468 domain-containing protein [Alphaproteobacteria bacterium]